MSSERRQFTGLCFLMGLVLGGGLIVPLWGQTSENLASENLIPESQNTEALEGNTESHLSPVVEGDPVPTSPDPGDLRPFRIRNIVVTVQGNTQPRRLEAVLDLEKGRIFPNREGWETYLTEARQSLNNLRLFETMELDYSVLEPGVEDGENRTEATPFQDVEVRLHVVDSWSFLVVPLPRYDSNEGFRLSLRAKDTNFLGTMRSLDLDFDLIKGFGNDDWFIDMQTSFELPFMVDEQDWMFRLLQQFRVDDEETRFHLEYGITMPADFLGAGWKFTYGQAFTVTNLAPEFLFRGAFSREWEQEQLTWFTEIYQDYRILGNDDPDKYYATLGASLGFRLPLGFELPLLGEPTYSPRVFTSWNYMFHRLPRDPERQGIRTGLGQSLSAGQLNWQENLRQGLETGLSHQTSYVWIRDFWNNLLDAKVQYHGILDWGGLQGSLLGQDFTLLDSLGLSLRALFRWDLGEGDSVNGQPLRGILDERLEAERGAFFNADISLVIIKVPDLWGFPWGEMQVSGFYDAALVAPLEADWLPLQQGFGMEVLLFPYLARSYFIRASLGFDLEAFLAGDIRNETREIFIGLGHHY